MTTDPHATVRMHLDVLAGRYRLEGVVASGGVATVVQATDLLLDRPVAVKLLKDATDCDEDRARFLLETQTLARLSHPGLVTMLDAGATSDGRPYLVMELVDGPSMSAVLRAPLDLVRAADIGAQVARALDYAHAHGVVHRDVKPGNVLLRSDGRAKLADFGIARLVGQRSEHTKTGVVVGSVHYLAPEQVAFEEITPAVDVYALGMLLIRAVTGQHAFDGSTIETALARLSAVPEIPDDLPSGWRTLLTAMTARRPEDRPTAGQVAERLTLLSGVRTTPTVLPPLPLDTATPVRTVAPPTPLARRRGCGGTRGRGVRRHHADRRPCRRGRAGRRRCRYRVGCARTRPAPPARWVGHRPRRRGLQDPGEPTTRHQGQAPQAQGVAAQAPRAQEAEAPRKAWQGEEARQGEALARGLVEGPPDHN